MPGAKKMGPKVRNQDRPGNLPRGRGKFEDGGPLSGAEDEISGPAGATSLEAEARSRTVSHCLGAKMRIQDHWAVEGNLHRGS